MKNKLILTLSLIGVASAASCKANDDSSWFEYFVSIFWGSNQKTETQAKPQEQSHYPTQHPQPSAPSQYQDTVGQAHRETQKYSKQQAPQALTNAQRAQVQRDVEAIIDELFAAKEQEVKTRREISAIKEKTVRCIQERTKQSKTVQELRDATNYYLVECLASTVARNARLLYEQQATKSSGQPAYSPTYLAQQTEDEIKTHALNAIKLNERGVLAFFVGQELEKRITAKVARDYIAPRNPAPTPSAPPAELTDDIYEIYVHEKAARREQAIAKIQQGKTHRETECSVCMDEFGGTKMRATLACGHSICPECLHNWLYQQRKNTCPVCRDTIRSDEFPATYLQQFID